MRQCVDCCRKKLVATNIVFDELAVRLAAGTVIDFMIVGCGFSCSWISLPLAAAYRPAALGHSVAS